VGERDQFVFGEQVRSERGRLLGLGFNVEWRGFPGGHVVDKETLVGLGLSFERA
jgi:hypothetical protein